jgi:CRISPR-associated protein Csb1
MSKSALFDRITQAVARPNGDVAVISRSDLTPIGGIELNRVMPPTYTGEEAPGDTETPPRYHVEQRCIKPGELVNTVVIDSPQSCVNRQEQALLDAYNAKLVPMPMVYIKFRSTNELYSVLQMPHRIFDAAIRDSNFEGRPFIESDLARRIYSHNHSVAYKAVLEHSPATLVFGGWASQVGSSTTSRGLRHPKMVINEIIGGLAAKTVRSSSRIDPLPKTPSARSGLSKICPRPRPTARLTRRIVAIGKRSR